MSLDRFRTALASKLGEVVTPELAAWLEESAFDKTDSRYDLRQFESDRYQELEFHVEHIADIVEDIHPLHFAHWAETEGYKQASLQMDYKALDSWERSGSLMQFTARASGALVGSIRVRLFISALSGQLCVGDYTLYLKPEQRQGFAAIRFSQYVERCLKQIGVHSIQADSKTANNSDAFFKYLGYTQVASVFYKVIGE